MKTYLFLLFATLSLTALAQDTLNLHIKEQVDVKKFKCRNATVMDVCKTIIYKTNHPDLLYKINYDKEGRPHSQGPVVKEEIDEAGRHRTEYFETGKWMFFDYDKNEIIYFECVYSNTPGCRVVSKDELRRDKIY